MQTTVVLGCPIEHTALSELVPTPDESLIISLVSPILLSVTHNMDIPLIMEIERKKITFIIMKADAKLLFIGNVISIAERLMKYSVLFWL